MSAALKMEQRGVPSAVRRVLNNGRVWAIQGMGTPLLLALAYAWFWIREARWWQLTGSLLLALFILYLAVFLQRTALRVFRRDRLGAAAAGGKARSLAAWLPRAVLVVFVFAALAWVAGELHDELPSATQFVSSWLTLHLRRPVDPYLLTQRVQSVEFTGAWLLFVVLWLPLAAAALLGESALWRAAAHAWRRLGYWLATLACVVVGYVAFWKLAEWVPKLKGIPAQTASMLARLGVAYVIALGAWLVILALVEEAIAGPAPRSPDETWESTDRPH